MKTRIKQAARLILGRPVPRTIPREISSLTPEEVSEARLFFPLRKFFIFGHARSGTTILARLVRLHPEVHCNYQAHFFTRPPLLEALVADREVEAWLTRGSNRWNRGKDLSPVILRAAADMILEREARRENKPIVGDKSPNSLMDGQAVHLMHKIYPDARLLYIIRDGRDTVLSHRIQAFIDFPEQLSPEDLRIRTAFSQDPELFLHGEHSLFTGQGIRRAAEGWVRNVIQTHQFGQELYGERYQAIRYEDLLSKPWNEMSRIWNFLGALPGSPELEGQLRDELRLNPDADWQAQKAREIAEPLQKGRHGSWQEIFTDRDRQVFHQVAGETLESWGYEPTHAGLGQ